jgi:hypothetical protein
MLISQSNQKKSIEIKDLEFLEEIVEQDASNISGGASMSIVRQYNDFEGISSIGFGVSFGGNTYGLGIGFGNTWGRVGFVFVNYP